MKLFLLFLLVAALGAAQTSFEVVRKKALWFDQKGTVRIDDSGLSFAANGEGEKGEKHDKTHSWQYEDIQHLDRVSPTELVLLSYEDVAWKLGRDRSYRFELTAGELTDEVFERAIARIGRPATDRVVDTPASAQQEIPAKNLTRFGGSEGVLYFSPERIVYASKAEKRSREWLLERDVQSVWSSDPYRLEVHAYEGSADGFRKPRVYRFALKRPLDAEFYRRLKLRLYDIDRERDLTP